MGHFCVSKEHASPGLYWGLIMSRHLNALLKDKTGATAVEYALIVALLAAVIVGAVATLGGGISTAFNSVSTKLTNSTGSL